MIFMAIEISVKKITVIKVTFKDLRIQRRSQYVIYVNQGSTIIPEIIIIINEYYEII